MLGSWMTEGPSNPFENGTTGYLTYSKTPVTMPAWAYGIYSTSTCSGPPDLVASVGFDSLTGSDGTTKRPGLVPNWVLKSFHFSKNGSILGFTTFPHLNSHFCERDFNSSYQLFVFMTNRYQLFIASVRMKWPSFPLMISH